MHFCKINTLAALTINKVRVNFRLNKRAGHRCARGRAASRSHAMTSKLRMDYGCVKKMVCCAAPAEKKQSKRIYIIDLCNYSGSKVQEN